MATTDVSLIEFSAIPLLDPAAPIQPGWLLLVEDNVSGAVWRATTLQAKASIAPTLVPTAQSAPTVSLALSASSGLLGAVITLSATATSTTAAIAKVDFFDSGVKVGSATAQPYQVTYSPALSGRHTIVAVATDANGTATTSASQFLDISAPVAAPIIVALSPIAPGTVGTAISLVASASMVGGTIVKVEFFDGANKIGEAGSSPYGSAYVPTTAGPHYFTAKATTLTGASAVSPAVTVAIAAAANIADQPPSCSISASNTNMPLGYSTTLSALAADADGTIAKLEFFDGSVLLASFASSPYSYLYTPTTTGGHSITAKATDNSGSVTTASLLVTVNAVAVYATAPTNVNASYVPIGSGFPTAVVLVSWLAPPAVPGAPVLSYYIYRDGGPVPVGQSSTLNYTDSYISPGQQHSYIIAAVNSSGVGPQSIASPLVTIPSAATTAANTVPGAPTNLVGTPSSNSVYLTYAAPAVTGGLPITGYNIYRAGVFLNNTINLYYTDSTAVNSTATSTSAYLYTVVAVNSFGPSVQSMQALVIMPVPAATITAPGQPTGVYASLGAAAAYPTITVSANAPNNGGAAITGYTIYRNGSATPLPGATNIALPYVDNTAVNGTSYTYTVAAVNSVGTGIQSTASPAVMPMAPAPTAPTYNTTLTGPGPITIASGQPGAGITLTSGGVDVLKFNSITGGSSLAQRMNISISGTVVAAVDFPASYVGAGFSYTPASGTLHSGTFANSTVII